MDLKFDLFKIDKENKIPQKGKLLISEPFLSDSFFGRSVVLLTEHNSSGSIGFILNRYSDIKLSEVMENFPKEFKLSYGGPVETNTLHFLHSLGKQINNSIKISENLFWGGDFEQLKELIGSNIAHEGNVRFFLGYSGWESGQLNNELKNNYWVVTTYSGHDYLKIDEELWEKCLNEIGGKYKSWINVPADPEMN
ncbi:MAG: YqgE/AlgH family protein [Bacteroidota bacterium]